MLFYIPTCWIAHVFKLIYELKKYIYYIGLMLHHLWLFLCNYLISVFFPLFPLYSAPYCPFLSSFFICFKLGSKKTKCFTYGAQTNCVCHIPHSPASATFVSEIIYHVPVVLFTFSCRCARAYSLLCVRLFICMCFICPSVFIQSLCGDFLAGEADAGQPQYSHTHAMCNPTEKSPTRQRRGMRQRHVRA